MIATAAEWKFCIKILGYFYEFMYMKIENFLDFT